MRRPRVSVCVTTCNQVAYIRRALESVLNQKAEVDLEVLVGDDCSHDGTSDVVAAISAENPGRLTHIRHSSRLGASQNTQHLVQRARGEYITRLDGDDYWLPGKVDRQIQFLSDQPECVAVYTNALTVDKDNRPIGIFNDVGDRTFDLSELLRRGNFLNNSSMMLRAELRQPWLALDGPLVDYRIHLLHAQRGALGHIGTPFVAYRVASAGSMVVNEPANVRRLYWEAIQSVPRDLVGDDVFAQALANFYCRTLRSAVHARDFTLAMAWWSEVRKASPYGFVRTARLTLKEGLRLLSRTPSAIINRDFRSRHLPIMYRR